MSCNKDCLNCKKEYCTAVYRDSSRYCNRSEHSRQVNKDYQKKKRDEAREKGLCIICKKKPQEYGSKCYECYLRQKRYDKRKVTGKRQLWKDLGKCYFCGKDPVPGHSTCPKHYKVCRTTIEICNASPNTQEARRRMKDEMQVLWKRN